MRYFHPCADARFPPDQLLRQAIAAEAAGSDGLGCSDHLRPRWEPGEPVGAIELHGREAPRLGTAVAAR